MRFFCHKNKGIFKFCLQTTEQKTKILFATANNGKVLEKFY